MVRYADSMTTTICPFTITIIVCNVITLLEESDALLDVEPHERHGYPELPGQTIWHAFEAMRGRLVKDSRRPNAAPIWATTTSIL